MFPGQTASRRPARGRYLDVERSVGGQNPESFCLGNCLCPTMDAEPAHRLQATGAAKAESLRSCYGLSATVDGESVGKLQATGAAECREPEIVLWPVSDCGR